VSRTQTDSPADKLLQVLTIIIQVNYSAGNVGKIATRVHCQEASQIDPGVLTGVSGLGFEAILKTKPGISQAIGNIVHRLHWQTPALRSEYA